MGKSRNHAGFRASLPLIRQLADRIPEVRSTLPMSSAQTAQALDSPTPVPLRERAVERSEPPQKPAWQSGLADSALIGLFLALAFLLGAFPLKDVDFYWHLRTGDLIRQTWLVPRTDIFTFTREGTPWLDLHWVFQIGVSWLYERAGVVGLSLAKCVITCLALLLLVTARRPQWPVWAMLLAWLPALLVLSGRMYVRPETLTLLYMSIFLAVVTRWDRFPYLALLLPVVQVAWVNSQGLFVFGPIILIIALLDALVRPGRTAPARKGWWRIVLLASLATVAACLINPYGIRGALYPLELISTMRNPVFSRSVAELLPVPEFIRRTGWFNLPLQLHLAAMALGVLSFAVPMGWRLGIGVLAPEPNPAAPQAAAQGERSSRQRKGRKRKGRSNAGRAGTDGNALRMGEPAEESGPWRISLFRLLLFGLFCFLSVQATRNTHQFAAVAGAVTAWNFGEWAAHLERRRTRRQGGPAAPSRAIPRLVTCGAILTLLLFVGTGSFYALAGEGRTLGLAEEPLWFPREAVKFAGKPGMPQRFLSFHNGHASLFEYYHGPARKVYTDPRLEVAGPELFERYTKLEERIKFARPGWEAELDELGRPVILVDHEFNSAAGATLLTSRHWRCAWFDAIAAVFVHDSYAQVVQSYTVDFAARHFRPDPATEPTGRAELKAAARGLRNYVSAISPARPALARPLVWLGLRLARRLVQEEPGSIDGWKALGQLELFRAPPPAPAPRFRAPFDPVLDLSLLRATYALRRGLKAKPDDALSLLLLKMAFDARQMDEAVLPVLDRMAALHPINGVQREQQQAARRERRAYEARLGMPPSSQWRNSSELDQIVKAQLSAGRAESAAETLERAYPGDQPLWAVADRIATLRLHLGEPARARELWRKARLVPEPGLREARVALTHLVEGDFERARRSYTDALNISPNLFEARYALAVLERDAGDASAAFAQAILAAQVAPDDSARTAARALSASVARYAGVASQPDREHP
jgi:tetratricopeptide (TPR) repeat protein